MNLQPENILIQDYTYSLPTEKIAVFPLANRDESKLLFFNQGKIEDYNFHKLPALLPAHSTLVLNDTRVIEARLFFQKTTGGVIELFCLEPYEKPIETALEEQGTSVWHCLIGGASKWKPGQVLRKESKIKSEPVVLEAQYVGRQEDSFLIQFRWQPQYLHFAQVLHATGAMPLPPYIKRKAEHLDEERYQTVFSTHEGSVAAPTAALHFTDTVFAELEKKNIQKAFVTLHVGAGTFKPVKSVSMAGHNMHSEVFSVTQSTIQLLLQAQRIITVGTTSLRTVESLHWLGLKLLRGDEMKEWSLGQWESYGLEQTKNYRQSYAAILSWMQQQGVNELHCRTGLLIVPGYSFKVASELITNFHQPQSTLLLLVAAFAGEKWTEIYDHALKNDYRFLSYGDSSYLRPAETPW